MNPRGPLTGGKFALLVIALLALVPLWPIFQGNVVGPFSQIQAMLPWGGQAQGSWDILQADGVLQFWAWRSLVLQGWAAFDLPFWNPYQLMGAPLLANSQSGVFYPPHIILGLLKVPVGLSLNLLAWGHLVWAGLGIYLLSRKLGASQWGSTFGGAAFALCPFLLTWLPLSSVPTTVSWIPWCLAFAAGLVLGRGSWGTQLAGLAFSFAMMILAGHLQFVFYGGVAVALVSLVLLGFRFKQAGIQASGASLGFGLLAIVLGVAIALPQLAPVLTNSRTSHRVASATQEGYQAYVKGALAPYELPGLVFPSLMGYPGQPAAVEMEGSPPSYWPAYIRIGAAPGEGAWGVGPLVLALAFFAFRRVRKEGKWTTDGSSPGIWATGGLSLFAFLLALGTPINALLYFGIPGFSATGSPGRVIVLLVLGLCVLAALAWPTEEDEEELDKKQLLIYGAVPVVLGLAFVGLFARGNASWIKDFNVDAFVSAQFSQGLIPLVLAIAAMAACLHELKFKRWQTALAAGCVAQLALGAWMFVPTGKPFLEPQTPNSERFAAINGQWDLLVPAKAVLPPNTGSVLHRRDVAGYDSLLNRDTVEILREVNAGQDPAPPANGNIMHVKPGASLQALAEAGVSWLVVAEDVEEPPIILPEPGSEEVKATQYWRKVDKDSAPSGLGGNGVSVFSLAGPGRAYLEKDGQTKRVDFAQDGLSKQVLKVAGPGRLIIKDRMMEGWSATVSGKPYELKTDSKWREVDIPEGDHEVVFTYTPPGMTPVTFAASIAAVIVALCCLIFSKTRTSNRANKSLGPVETDP